MIGPVCRSTAGNFALLPDATREATREMAREIDRAVTAVAARHEEQLGVTPVVHALTQVGGTGGGMGKIGEVAGRAAKRRHHAARGMGIATVQRFARDGGEDIGDDGAAGLRNVCVKLLEADRDVPDLAAGGLGKLCRHFREGHRSRAGHLRRQCVRQRWGITSASTSSPAAATILRAQSDVTYPMDRFLRCAGVVAKRAVGAALPFAGSS